MGGKRTLRSIRKQSAPHMIAIVVGVMVAMEVEVFERL